MKPNHDWQSVPCLKKGGELTCWPAEMNAMAEAFFQRHKAASEHHGFYESFYAAWNAALAAAPTPPKPKHDLERLLRDWGAISKALTLTKLPAHLRGELGDHDDELPGLIERTAAATLEWRDDPERWNALPALEAAAKGRG